MQEDFESTGDDIKAPAVETPEAPTLELLKAQMQTAIAEGNDADVVKLGKFMVKFKSDIEKQEGDKLKAEAEAMAGDRQKLASKILKAVKGLVDVSELAGVKAKGFTFNLPDEAVAGSIASVALLVPAVRKSSGGGGGSTGALKEQTGLSRHELIDKYATPDEVAGIKKAYDEAPSRPDSARYSAEKPVIKRILADNPSLIKR